MTVASDSLRQLVERVALAAVALAAALAHVLELPGKLRLTRDGYLTVQKITTPDSQSRASANRLHSL